MTHRRQFMKMVGSLAGTLGLPHVSKGTSGPFQRPKHPYDCGKILPSATVFVDGGLLIAKHVRFSVAREFGPRDVLRIQAHQVIGRTEHADRLLTDLHEEDVLKIGDPEDPARYIRFDTPVCQSYGPVALAQDMTIIEALDVLILGDDRSIALRMPRDTRCRCCPNGGRPLGYEDHPNFPLGWKPQGPDQVPPGFCNGLKGPAGPAGFDGHS